MPKRLTATEKWQDGWFCGLSDNNKLFWLYALDTCNHAGIWDENFTLFRFYVKDFIFNKEIYENRMINFADKKWFIPKFIEFQYGRLNPDNRAHASVLSILGKYGLKKFLVSKEGASKGLVSPMLGSKDKDKDKDKERGDYKGGKDFESFWKAYPRKVAKPAALKAWLQHKPDLQQVIYALKNQSQSPQWQKDGGQFIPHPATWLNQERWNDEATDMSTDYDDIPSAEVMK